jgi:hypothetical protein
MAGSRSMHGSTQLGAPSSTALLAFPLHPLSRNRVGAGRLRLAKANDTALSSDGSGNSKQHPSYESRASPPSTSPSPSGRGTG